MVPIAHINGENYQTLESHLINVAKICSEFALKIKFPTTGELLGLLHDLGKYSKTFQSYLNSAAGIIEQDADEYVNPESMKGKIDHSTSGAQYIWNLAKNQKNQIISIIAQFLSLCIASHHSGLIDCISPEGVNEFIERMKKSTDKTYLDEVIQNADQSILEGVSRLLSESEIKNEFASFFKKIIEKNNNNETLIRFHSGLLIRTLFSCLIDADRIDTIDFGNPRNITIRKFGKYTSWDILIDRFVKHINSFKNKTCKNRIDEIRDIISAECFKRANEQQGIFTLTVPTGGGKTLSSLRFALQHAKIHQLDRIIYVIPFTSIIEQNASIVREILEVNNEENGQIVLEHHSNLLPELQTWKHKLLKDDWDAPIIFTTTVQFLETIFGAGTRSVRRLHQLTKSVIIFDEIQTLPVKTIHLFNNSINFLVNHCNSTVVLCTATQPLLNKVNETKGKLNFNDKNEIMPHVEELFKDLKRVEIVNQCKTPGWTNEEIAELALQKIKDTNNCLIVVNTKQAAQELFEVIKKQKKNLPLYHLSTSMCSAHRLVFLNEIKHKLIKEEQFICVSTQLIEAGVDIDFGTVIRFIAGIDSIIQAAGRCNRNGKRQIGYVYVVNPIEENIDVLEDIRVGKNVSLRILNEMKDSNTNIPGDLINPKILVRYYEYYFYNRADQMIYPVSIGRDDNLLNLLSTNDISIGEYCRINGSAPEIYFRQSFRTASELFKSIDAPTIGIVVPYSDEGKNIIADLSSQFAYEKQYDILRRAQRYTVNVFPNILKKLIAQQAIKEVPDIGIYFLSDLRYYHEKFGLCTEIINNYETLIY